MGRCRQSKAGLVWTLQPGEAEIVGERIAQLLT